MLSGFVNATSTIVERIASRGNWLKTVSWSLYTMLRQPKEMRAPPAKTPSGFSAARPSTSACSVQRPAPRPFGVEAQETTALRPAALQPRLGRPAALQPRLGRRAAGETRCQGCNPPPGGVDRFPRAHAPARSGGTGATAAGRQAAWWGRGTPKSRARAGRGGPAGAQPINFYYFSRYYFS